MKKIITYVLLISAISFLFKTEVAYSQAPEAKLWPVPKKQPRSIMEDVIGSDKTGFYTLRSDYSKTTIMSTSMISSLFLDRYDKGGQFVSKKELIMPVPTKINGKLNFEHIYYLKGQLILFSSYFNKANNQNTIFANKINPEVGVENKTVMVATYTGATKDNKGTFEFVVSNDSSKVLVFENLPDEKKGKEKFQFKVIDNQLNIISSQDVTLPYQDDKAILSNWQVDNDGKVYVLVGVDNNSAKNNENNFTYKIYTYTPNEEQGKQFEIRIASKYVVNANFSLDNNKNLIIGGFYANQPNILATGSFFIKLDKEGKEVITQKVQDFNPQLITEAADKNSVKDKKSGIADLVMQRPIINKDGTIFLIAEQQYAYVLSNGSSTVSHFYNNNILVFKVKPDGDIDWVSLIPKEVHTDNTSGAPMFRSLISKADNEKVYLLYNDNAQNLNITDPKKIKTTRSISDANAMLVTIDNSGKIQKKALLPNKDDQKYLLNPRYSIPDSNGFILHFSSTKNDRFGYLNF